MGVICHPARYRRPLVREGESGEQLSNVDCWNVGTYLGKVYNVPCAMMWLHCTMYTVLVYHDLKQLRAKEVLS